MRTNIYKQLLSLLLAALPAVAHGQETTHAPEAALNATTEAEAEAVDTNEIKAAIQSYAEAFNARDVQKLAGHWSPEGVYISRTTGEQVVGRDAIAEEFAAMFAGEIVPTIAVTTDSIEFISPNVALERGKATVTFAEDDIVETNYKVVYVQRDNTWLIDRVTEEDIAVTPSNYEHLKDLEFLIGEWIDEGEGFTIEIDSSWTRNQTFIARKFTISVEDEVQSSGLQIIGWDAKLKQIRSWLFDSSGTVVTGTWAQRDDRWIVSSIATLADGGTGSFTAIFRPLDDGNYGWQKINQVLDGELLPHVDETIHRRK